MGHVVLLGDSIFDNASYVPGEPPVIQQVRERLPAGWKATLLAVDGSITQNVSSQLAKLPADASLLFVSAGGNNALGEANVLGQSVTSVGAALQHLRAMQNSFAQDYHAMMQALLATDKPVTVCTIYDAIPELPDPEKAALSLFNDAILLEAFRAGAAVIDLRLVCDRADDYSSLSPIEPSARGGAKIASMIAAVATRHNFTAKQTRVYY
jgi:hypothetical protein